MNILIVFCEDGEMVWDISKGFSKLAYGHAAILCEPSPIRSRYGHDKVTIHDILNP